MSFVHEITLIVDKCLSLMSFVHETSYFVDKWQVRHYAYKVYTS